MVARQSSIFSWTGSNLNFADFVPDRGVPDPYWNGGGGVLPAGAGPCRKIEPSTQISTEKLNWVRY